MSSNSTEAGRIPTCANSVEPQPPAEESWRCTDCGRFALPTKRCRDPNVPKAVCITCYANSQSPFTPGALLEDSSTFGCNENHIAPSSISKAKQQNRKDAPDAESSMQSLAERKNSADEALRTSPLLSNSSLYLADGNAADKGTTRNSVQVPEAKQISVPYRSGSSLDNDKGIVAGHSNSEGVPSVVVQQYGPAVISEGPPLNVTAAVEKNVERVRIQVRQSSVSPALDEKIGPKTRGLRDDVRQEGNQEHAELADTNGDEFRPGTLVWAGGRGYAGGVWDPWPGRVVEAEMITLRDFRNVSSRKRAVMLFNHDRKFVLMNVSALRHYVPGPLTKKIRFRDSRGYLACIIANACAQRYSPTFSGIVDEDLLRRTLSESDLMQCKCLGENSSSHSKSQAPQHSTEEQYAPLQCSTPQGHRKRRTAAVKNPFCTSGDDVEISAKPGWNAAPASTSVCREAQSLVADGQSADARGIKKIERNSKNPVVETEHISGYPLRPPSKRARYAEEVYDDENQQNQQHAKTNSKQSPALCDSAPERAPEQVMYDKPSKSSAEGATSLARESGNRENRLGTAIDLALLGVEQIADVLTQFVCQGLASDVRLLMGKVILSGCARYTLNGRALLARKPVEEIVASAVLEDRGTDVEDGIYWATVEFIHLAREGKMDLQGLHVKS